MEGFEKTSKAKPLEAGQHPAQYGKKLDRVEDKLARSLRRGNSLQPKPWPEVLEVCDVCR
jgi:hypothetical protein